MKYTKQQIKDAYCEKYNIKIQQLPQEIERQQSMLDMRRFEMQKELVALQTDAKELMKKEAIEFLVEKSKNSILEENKDVTL